MLHPLLSELRRYSKGESEGENESGGGWFSFNVASPQRDDLRLSGPPSGKGVGKRGSNPRQKSFFRFQSGFATHCVLSAPQNNCLQKFRLAAKGKAACTVCQCS
ncbi:hypothetical protein PoB_007543900 [Plakobranchus ocellatus]|uniref:Uncharacterized protein n=1 Tax=Plakobranchus ocellatus TaxID=259542 RepID=A0AAV4DXY8_9GAST|nr:hypothetical protein PoB_007543900 [Plakobranchus ocellatus]